MNATRTSAILSAWLLAAALACNPAATSGPPQNPTAKPANTGRPAADTAIPPPAEHRIGIRLVGGVAEFYDRLTGEKFVPRGAALWRWKHWPPGEEWVIDIIFNTEIGQLDSALAELPKMHADGYNVVRLWFNACWGGAPGCLDRVSGGLDRAFLQNMARFLQVAKENEIYVILTMDSLPDLGYASFLAPYRNRYEGFNLEYLTQGGVDAQSKYQTDLIRGLMEVGAPMDAILAYQPKEEAYFEENLAPLSASSGMLTPANGKTYDLADPTQRRALMEDSWVYYIDHVTAAIKAVDPTALVTMGFFVQQEPNPVLVGDPRKVYLHKVLYESALDFVSLSAYPGFNLTMQQQAENFDIVGYTRKPIVIGEFGAERSSYPDVHTAAVVLQAWQVASCEVGVDGWQVWTWDGGGNDIHDLFWEAVDDNGAIRRALSPALNPDPCAPGEEMTSFPNLAFGKPAQTSAAYDPAQSGGQAVDLSQRTQWNAGNGPPQWIEVDLKQPSSVETIRLFVAQEPEGLTVHRVSGRGASGDYQLLHEFRGVTREGDVLEYSPPQPWQNIRFVRVETTTSPSWVSWHEIEVIGTSHTAETAPAAPFTGTWQGPDPDDGSTMTIALVQSGNTLTGTFKDAFSGSVPPPGYEGTGSGSLLSPTTAQMTFQLTRHDGRTVEVALNFTLSNQNNTLTITSDAPATPWVMQRQ